MTPEIFQFAFAILGTLAVAMVFIFISRALSRYLEIKSAAGIGVFLLSLVLGAAAAFYRAQLGHNRNSDLPHVFAAGIGTLLSVPFAFKLYSKWVAGNLTDAEKLPTIDGVRAWLRGGNLAFAVLLSLGAWAGFGYSFFATLALFLMALLAYPILNMSSAYVAPAPEPSETLSPEREKVLKMLEDGKITAEESAELLNALGHTIRPAKVPPSSSDPNRKMILTGLALLLIGFFLPWYSFTPNEELSQTLSGMQDQINNLQSQNPNLHFNFPSLTSTVNVSGADIQHGLGWLVLLLGIAAAALPYVAENLEPEIRHRAKLIGLGVGSMVLIYLLAHHMRFASVGILLGLAGYALQFLGTLKERAMAAR